LVVRRVPDKEGSTRVVKFDEETGARKLVDPTTPGTSHEPWPTKGWNLENTPEETTVSQSLMRQWIADGFVTAEGERVEHAPGGPPEDPWRVTHTFYNYDTVTFHTLDGDVSYDVTFNPGKYNDDVDADNPGPGKRVVWAHTLELMEDNRDG
jgi:hypothetical protein